MDNPGGGCYRLPVLVLIVLVIIGAILLSAGNTPENQPEPPAAPPQEDTGYVNTPALTPTVVDLARTEVALAEKAKVQAAESSLRATAAAQAQQDLEMSKAYSAATLQVLETQAVLLQANANAASTQAAIQRSQSEAASRASQQAGELNVVLALSAGVACSLLLIVAGMVIYRNQEAQRNKDAAAAAHLAQQRRLVEADIHKIETQIRLIQAQSELAAKKVSTGNGNGHHPKTEVLSWPDPPARDDEGFPDLPFAE